MCTGDLYWAEAMAKYSTTGKGGSPQQLGVLSQSHMKAEGVTNGQRGLNQSKLARHTEKYLKSFLPGTILSTDAIN